MDHGEASSRDEETTDFSTTGFSSKPESVRTEFGDSNDDDTGEAVRELPNTIEKVEGPPWPPTAFYTPEVLAAQKKSLSSLQRSLVLCHEMDAFAKHTITKLADGANKFQMMEDQQNEMEKDLLETADNFEDMGKCCGFCPWTKRRRGPVEDASDSAPPPVPLAQSRSTIRLGMDDQKPSSLIIIPHDHVELQMEYEMELVEGFVDQLEQMSTDIHGKLTLETEAIQSVTDKMDKNIIRVVLARHKAKALVQEV
ncbi:hypothetical protein BV898_16338 [Hypsibius exemplaris]|uniref:t-SNARE coiled-coil homology domain-containing protein n=1 Tax=Hypsibius exemplaris TaxID=2072580 RepID=A0A9X6RLQ5_HYPEX|nr:hypothetical protein BV898_16338 [Hypsibius exemplaris]